MATISQATMGKMATVIAEVTRKYIRDVVKPLHERIAALEARPVVRYMGVFAPGRSYPEGAMVTHGGSVWHAEKLTASTPGSSPEDWVLAVKRGRDGK